jgi:hypothetical protein
MKRFIETCKKKPRTLAVAVALLVSYLFYFYASSTLTQSYQDSLFPVPYYEAQMSFDADKIKGWYAFLIEHNTFDKYLYTQHIDFIFMVSVLLLHFFALLLVSRLFPSTSRWRTGMIVCAIASSLAPIADALENLVSYIMLADPLQFPAYLVYIYSSFAVLKFSMFVFAYAAFGIGLVAAFMFHAYGLVQSYIKRGNPANH